MPTFIRLPSCWRVACHDPSPRYGQGDPSLPDKKERLTSSKAVRQSRTYVQHEASFEQACPKKDSAATPAFFEHNQHIERCLLLLASKDFSCVRRMNVSYVDSDGVRKKWTGSGYRVKCHLPPDAHDVEVTFSVVGGRNVYKVDRRLPSMPWVKDADGQWPLERFVFPQCPQSVKFTVCGPSLHSFISQVSITPAQGPMRKNSQLDNADLFDRPAEEVPAIGGIVDLQEPFSENLVPAEVAFFEPSLDDIFDSHGARQIFLNTPLTDMEQAHLAEFHRFLAKKRVVDTEDAAFPRFTQTHALRILQTCKYNLTRSADMMNTCVKERLRRLPIAEKDVLPELHTGFMYWHGRDHNCRPCLVIRLERIGELVNNKERAVRSVLFTLEYALRFALVPGRVENWVVVIDLANVHSIISPMQLGKLAGVAKAIATALEEVYCGRMAWLKIVNMPGGGLFSTMINKLIPEEKRHKVSFLKDATELVRHFEPHQIEHCYGGTAPDLAPGETYPFHFFENARGVPPIECKCNVGSVNNALCEKNMLDFSLCEPAPLAFHEGFLWDCSTKEAKQRCIEVAQASSLTSAAGIALADLLQSG